MDNLITTPLSIEISEDKMGAYIFGSIPESLKHSDILRIVNTLLDKAQITYGIKEDLMNFTISELLNKRCIPKSLIAIGKRPYIVKTKEPQLTIALINKREIPSLIHLKEDEVLYYYQLKDINPTSTIVKKDSIIGRLLGHEPPLPGTNIFGETVSVETMPCQIEGFGNGITADPVSGVLLASLTGICIRTNKGAYIHPVNFDGVASVIPSKDQLTATLKIYPPGPMGCYPTFESVYKTLQRMSITFGVNKNQIRACLKNAQEHDNKSLETCIVTGKAPCKGSDARIDYAINLTTSHKPKIKPDGRADYYSIHTFRTVKANQIIGRIIPATKGIPGRSIYGAEIPTADGNNCTIQLGKNIVLDQKTGQFKSTIDGHVYERDHNLVVEPVLSLQSSVDFSTGNIDFFGDVTIKGDVLSGFRINAGGNVWIEGTVEDAFIDAQGSVIVKEGFVGRGKGRIKAGKDVILKHVRNQTVLSKENILIAGEALDAQLYAGNEILVESKKSWIIGGRSIARIGVRAFALGSSGNVNTEISVGLQSYIDALLTDLKIEIAQLNEDLTLSIKKRNDLQQQTLNRITMKEIQSLEKDIILLTTSLEKKNSQLQRYSSKLIDPSNDTKGQVSVIDTIYPGVVIHLGPFFYHVNKISHRNTFCIKESRIAIENYSPQTI